MKTLIESILDTRPQDSDTKVAIKLIEDALKENGNFSETPVRVSSGKLFLPAWPILGTKYHKNPKFSQAEVMRALESIIRDCNVKSIVLGQWGEGVNMSEDYDFKNFPVIDLPDAGHIHNVGTKSIHIKNLRVRVKSSSSFLTIEMEEGMTFEKCQATCRDEISLDLSLCRSGYIPNLNGLKMYTKKLNIEYQENEGGYGTLMNQIYQGKVQYLPLVREWHGQEIPQPIKLKNNPLKLMGIDNHNIGRIDILNLGYAGKFYEVTTIAVEYDPKNYDHVLWTIDLDGQGVPVTYVAIDGTYDC